MIIRADARHIPLKDKSVQCVISSPPYWGLRDYGTAKWSGGKADCDHVEERKQTSSPGTFGQQYKETCKKCGARRIDRQIGLEATPDEYVATMVGVFREVWRVLRDDGTVWLNLGDSYATQGGRGEARMAELRPWSAGSLTCGGVTCVCGNCGRTPKAKTNPAARGQASGTKMPPGLKPKDLCGMPWRVVFALQADGWYLRSDIVWAKPNPMPESVTDRPTRSHEYLFLLSKRERYFYDADAIREDTEPYRTASFRNGSYVQGSTFDNSASRGPGTDGTYRKMNGRNKRDVWTVNSEPTPEAHFATFPQKLIEPCILAGTSERGCCKECGAPRVREIGRTGVENDANIVITGTVSTDNCHQTSGRVRQLSGPTYQKVIAPTGGWRLSCKHDEPSVPCVIFDPFLGSGTVGKVAIANGRRWVGLELSEAYIKIAKKRVKQHDLKWKSKSAEAVRVRIAKKKPSKWLVD